MKKNILIILCAVLGLCSCYPDYIKDSASQGVAFANNVDVRTVVVGEGLKFYTGVALAGVITNNEDRTVAYAVDEDFDRDATLLAMQTHTLSYINQYANNFTSLQLLPSSEYSLINDGGKDGQTVIAQGSHTGRISVQIDSAAYFAGAASLVPDYVIPLRITDAGSLGIISGYETTVIGVHYENMLYGNWYHGGKASCETSSKSYATEIPQLTDRVWTLSTVAPHSLTANAVAWEVNSNNAQMKLTLGEDGSVVIEPVEGATYKVEADGESRYNRARLLQDRKIFLNYKFTDKDGNLWHATDTLTFRNRVRDGVNEWQDENQENYK